jgi:thymidylate kinase
MSTELICLTGAPGCGKTAHSARLAAKLTARGLKVALLTVWDAMLDPAAASKLTLRRPGEFARHAETLDPAARTKLEFHGLALAVELVGRRGADVVIAPGYWYAPFAAGVAAGVNRAELRRMGLELPSPNITFYLRVGNDPAPELDDLARELGWLERVGAAAASRVPNEAAAMLAGRLTTDTEETP